MYVVCLVGVNFMFAVSLQASELYQVAVLIAASSHHLLLTVPLGKSPTLPITTEADT